MNGTLQVMLKLWNMNTMDWLGYDNQEIFTYHHIVKKCNGGNKLPLMTNGAILHQSSHSYLHTIEYYDLDKYIFLNGILKAINEQKSMPSIEQLKQVKLVLKEFQNEYEGKLSHKNKLIIKKEYII